MKEILEQIAFHLEKGRSFSSILAMHSDVFDEVFIATVKSGEESGNKFLTSGRPAMGLFGKRSIKDQVHIRNAGAAALTVDGGLAM